VRSVPSRSNGTATHQCTNAHPAMPPTRGSAAQNRFAGAELPVISRHPVEPTRMTRTTRKTATMTKVKVYKFKVFIPKERAEVAARRMGTATYIASVGGKIIEGTEMEVDSSDVDSIGKTEIGYAG
jgi:hypothetical protein